jgi:NAD(P) transhydrogenase subunit alpha
MASFTVGVAAEAASGERRVALVPADVAGLTAAGAATLVASGAGAGAWFSDGAYAHTGADVVSAGELLARADVLLCVGTPGPDLIAALRPGQTVVGLMGLFADPPVARELAARGVNAITFDGLPRTLSRAQSMDALTSQASIAGYKAVMLAAATFGRLMPMQITAAGTSRPARVLVLGAGVAGLQAIGTARRLGAVVSAFDVRPAAKEEVASLGASFVDLGRTFGGAAGGGYARALDADEQLALVEALIPAVGRSDIVITTAQVPGRKPPLLVGDEAVKAMPAGSVIVDLSASTRGANVAPALPGQTVVTDNGVTVIGADNLPSTVAGAASTAYSHNMLALLKHLIHDGAIGIDLTDEIQQGVVAIHNGEVVHPLLKSIIQ